MLVLNIECSAGHASFFWNGSLRLGQQLCFARFFVRFTCQQGLNIHKQCYNYFMLNLLPLDRTRHCFSVAHSDKMSTEHIIGKLLSQCPRTKRIPDGFGNGHCAIMLKLLYRLSMRGGEFSCASNVDKICEIFILRSFSLKLCEHVISATLAILIIVSVLICR